MKLVILYTALLSFPIHLVSARSANKYADLILIEPLLDDLWGQSWPFQDINTFAHLDHDNCLVHRDASYDVGIIGVPFDTATSYRSGARFGPRAVRAALQRQTSIRGYNPRANFNPYQSWATIVDCGDIPVTPMNNELAFQQMTMAFEELLFEHASRSQPARYVAIGGDHSVLLPHLRALHKLYGPINIVHFDAHLDTWKPDKYPSFWRTHQSEVNHGSMLWKAYEEGLITTKNVHAGLRTKLSGPEDLEDDDEQHWLRIPADDVWVDGVQKVIDSIMKHVPRDTPTYISVDIDVLDPGFGSGTGTQEPGGWLPRELIYVLRGLEELTIVGADVVEVSPEFDHAEVTSTNGAQIIFEILTSIVKKGPLKLHYNKNPKKTPFNQQLEESKPVNVQFNEKLEKLERELKEVESLKQSLFAQLKSLKSLSF